MLLGWLVFLDIAHHFFHHVWVHSPAKVHTIGVKTLLLQHILQFLFLVLLFP